MKIRGLMWCNLVRALEEFGYIPRFHMNWQNKKWVLQPAKVYRRYSTSEYRFFSFPNFVVIVSLFCELTCFGFGKRINHIVQCLLVLPLLKLALWSFIREMFLDSLAVFEMYSTSLYRRNPIKLYSSGRRK